MKVLINAFYQVITVVETGVFGLREYDAGKFRLISESRRRNRQKAL